MVNTLHVTRHASLAVYACRASHAVAGGEPVNFAGVDHTRLLLLLLITRHCACDCTRACMLQRVQVDALCACVRACRGVCQTLKIRVKRCKGAARARRCRGHTRPQTNTSANKFPKTNSLASAACCGAAVVHQMHQLRIRCVIRRNLLQLLAAAPPPPSPAAFALFV